MYYIWRNKFFQIIVTKITIFKVSGIPPRKAMKKCYITVLYSPCNYKNL